ncbi:MAG: MFS transporter, partial [Phycisphaerae bacterium]|nr:MFS transporter [Phycisphaerae bacterium]
MPHDAFQALQHANYRRFAAGFMLNSLGLHVLTTAVMWDVWERTHDPLALGITGLCRALPVVLLALVAGHTADRFERTRIIMVCQACFAALCASFAWLDLHDAPVWQFYLLLVLSGCVRAFAGPARGSLLPLLVPRRNLENAVNWNSGLFQAAAISGPIATGLAIDSIGSTWQLYLVAAGLTASLAVVAPLLRPEPAPRATEGLTLRSLVAGARFIIGERVVFGALLLDLLAVLFGGATALLPMYADEILSIGQKGFAFGVLKASPYVGALIMAAFLASRPPIRRAGPALLWSVAGFGACMIVFGLSTSFWVAALALVTSGALDAISVTIRHMLVQTRTPNELRGRVSAV